MNRKRTFLGLIILLFLYHSNISWAEETNFRKTRWGMTKEEVLKSERKKPAYTSDDLLVYQSEVIGKKVLVEYHLVNDKLFRTKYKLAENYVFATKYIRDYGDFKEILMKKYGTPKENEMIWRNEFFKDDTSQWGYAVSTGQLKCFAKWETPSTNISVDVEGKNFSVFLEIEYFSKMLLPMVKELREMERKDIERGEKIKGNNKKLDKAIKDF